VLSLTARLQIVGKHLIPLMRSIKSQDIQTSVIRILVLLTRPMVKKGKVCFVF